MAAGIVACRLALQNWPQSFEVLVNLGDARSRLQRYDEALASYRQALVLKPDLVEGYMNIGNVISASGPTISRRNSA